MKVIFIFGSLFVLTFGQMIPTEMESEEDLQDTNYPNYHCWESFYNFLYKKDQLNLQNNGKDAYDVCREILGDLIYDMIYEEYQLNRQKNIEERIEEDVDVFSRQAEKDLENEVLSRKRRQSSIYASGLGINHQNPQGADRKVGKIFGRLDGNGNGQNSKNFHANLGAGLGSVLWRSKNKKHSVGAGVYASQSRGKVQNFSYKSKPDVGVGLGYKFRFGRKK